MKVNVIGSGYVGTTLACCLADWGHDVTAIDIDEEIVRSINSGRSPIHEPGLDELVEKNVGSTLSATTSYEDVDEADLTYVAVQTPSKDDGSIDIGALTSAVEMVGEALQETSDRHLVAIKSTVTPPQISRVRDVLNEAVGDASGEVELAANPEFQREGSAVEDFRNPHKVVFGTDSEWATERFEELFAPLLDGDTPVVSTDPQTAMMIKYANNTFLAAKISLINDIGNICKEFGIDTYEVADALGKDDRISGQFLRSGLGWGGSCFPKDTAALVEAARSSDYDPALLDAAIEVNAKQPHRMINLLSEHLEVGGKRIAVLGLSFKPGTGDTRNSRAIPLIQQLQDLGADVTAYDPVAMEEMRERRPEIDFADSAAEALEDSHAALIATAWEEFEDLDSEFDAMENPLVIDGRRVLEPMENVTYEGLTW